QLGEGLHEARLLRFLKQPGEAVAQDEPIYEMETDKAVMEIESPAAGVLAEWTASEDDVLPIGATIGRISTEAPEKADDRPQTTDDGRKTSDAITGMVGGPSSATEPNAQRPTPNARELLRNAFVPPRTKAYARENDELLMRS